MKLGLNFAECIKLIHFDLIYLCYFITQPIYKYSRITISLVQIILSIRQISTSPYICVAHFGPSTKPELK